MSGSETPRASAASAAGSVGSRVGAVRVSGYFLEEMTFTGHEGWPGL